MTDTEAPNIEKIAAGLTGPQRRVLGVLSCGEIVPPIEHYADLAKLKVSQTKRALKKLVREGLTELGPLIDDDGALCGTGYWRTVLGDSVHRHLMEQSNG